MPLHTVSALLTDAAGKILLVRDQRLGDVVGKGAVLLTGQVLPPDHLTLLELGPWSLVDDRVPIQLLGEIYP
jgi:hypothetical protein